MQSISSKHFRPLFLSAALLFSAAAPALADGSQMLGVPIGLAAPTGTRMIVAGQGVRDGQPQNLNITIPAGATIRQVVAYWSAIDWDLAKLATTDSITLAGLPVVGQRIGDPELLFNTGYNASYRADVTALHLLAVGNNAIAVNGIDFVWPSGAGLVAFVDDGGDAVEFEIFDGNDVISRVITPERLTSSVVSYTFEPATISRTGNLAMFFSSFFAATPTVITISIDGAVQEIVADAIGSDNGNAWDTVQKQVVVPAGATSMSVQLALQDSGLGRYAGSYTWGKMAWIYSGFSLEVPPPADDEGCSASFWKKHPMQWNGKGNNEFTQTVQICDSFNSVFNVKSAKSGFANCVSLYEVLWMCGNCNQSLAREAVAALANADSDINFPYTIGEVIALYRDGIGADAGPETCASAKLKLEKANELGCPLSGSSDCKPHTCCKAHCNGKTHCNGKGHSGGKSHCGSRSNGNNKFGCNNNKSNGCHH